MRKRNTLGPFPPSGSPTSRKDGFDRPRYTMIHVYPPQAGPWTHEFNLAGEEVIVYPVHNLPRIHAIDNQVVPAFVVNTIPPTAEQWQFPPYDVPSVFNTDAGLDELWGYLHFDSLKPFFQWDIAPGLPGGEIVRGAMAISNAHEVRARCLFRRLILTRHADPASDQALIIMVREISPSDFQDWIPT